MEEEIIFKIVSTSPLDVNLTLEEMRKYPSYNMNVNIYLEQFVKVNYKPAKGFDKEKFIRLMKKKLKRLYKAFSIEVFEPVKAIK